MDFHTSQSVAQVIQLAVTPVFLLVGIGSLLNVMAMRLGRVVDRARLLESEISEQSIVPEDSPALEELAVLDRRIVFCNWAINFSTIAALLIAFMIALLFLSDLARTDASRLVAILFVLTMASITLGLCAFLMEIAVASRTIRVRSGLLKK
ncbi:MAG: DUF2721 domain-containing protein [Pseudomonadota bacterium]